MDSSKWPEIPPQQSYNPHSSSYYPPNPNPNSANPQTNPIPPNHHTQYEPGTSLRSLGVDPYTPEPYAPNAGYEGPGAATSAAGPCGQPLQPTNFFHDPNAQQNWGANELNPRFGASGYEASVVPSNGMEQMVGENPNPMVWNNQRIHPFAKGINIKRNLNKTKVVQSAWCELCKTDCNSQDILNKHKLGKKHMKNLKKLEESKNVVAPEPVATMEPEDLKTVKEIPSGEVVQSAWCELCKTDCNSPDILNNHKLGKKHMKNLKKLEESKNVVAPEPVATMEPEDFKTVKGIPSGESVQSAWCELCKTDCNSQDILNKHKLGKKHMKNLKKLEESKNVVASEPVVTMEPEDLKTVEEISSGEGDKGKKMRRKRTLASKPEDLETKRQKLMECGTAVDSLRVCTVCNVVCNSEVVFNFHLAGQKHATMVNCNFQLKNLEDSKNVDAPEPVATMEPEDLKTVKEIPSEESDEGKKMKTMKTLASKPEDLETKRQKLIECGTTADSLKVCTLCNVVCNNEVVLNFHLAGQKHAAKVASLPEGMEPMVGPILNLVICNDQASHPTVNGAMEKKKKKSKKTEVVQPVWCELCKIDCSSQDVLNNHNLGKRHKKNLEKLEELKNAAVKFDLEVGTSESPSGEKIITAGGKAKRKNEYSVSKTEEDLETKKQKLLESGTMPDSLKVCTVCNIVCNSETVYNYHLTGQKHATQVKKQITSTAMSAVGPQLVTTPTMASTVSPQLVSAATAMSTVSPEPATAATMTPTVGPEPATAATMTPTVGLGPEPVTAAIMTPIVVPVPALAAIMTPIVGSEPATAATMTPTVVPEPATAATMTPTIGPEPASVS